MTIIYKNKYDSGINSGTNIKKPLSRHISYCYVSKPIKINIKNNIYN